MKKTEKCPCGSGKTYGDCCGPIIAGTTNAPTAEALMRARYSAYAAHEIDFILSSCVRKAGAEEIDPAEGIVPVLETRVQDLFGLADTPRVCGLPVLIRLLSPARRPLQITRDLAGFWRNTWPEVVKEMKGRYPKHRWPADPTKPGV
jgi:ATP-dependent helicase HrpB